MIPVYVLDPETEALGAAHKWRVGEGLAALDRSLAKHGLRLILRRGDALTQLRALVAQTGADAVHWSRLYDPKAIARDTRVKAGLRQDGIAAESHPGHLLFEPWQVETGQGAFYRVFTPFWNNVRGRDVGAAPDRPDLGALANLPESLSIQDLDLARAMNRGAEIVAKYTEAGEDAALEKLRSFCRDKIEHYQKDRDRLDVDGTSGLSEYLAVGEISPRSCWHAGCRARIEGKSGAETFLKELVWREFAYHLIYHTPHITNRSWRDGWESFPWRDDNDDAERWRRGGTGEAMIDAAMRELYVTGRMHNRARMLVASFLTKHMMTHWRVGRDWFADCLTDWDPASNALGWQWTAGPGPDAAPYFRVFNPATQAEKFDLNGDYRRRYLDTDGGPGSEPARDFYLAAPRSWGMSPKDPTPPKVVDLKRGRERALDAYQIHKESA